MFDNISLFCLQKRRYVNDISKLTVFRHIKISAQKNYRALECRPKLNFLFQTKNTFLLLFDSNDLWKKNTPENFAYHKTTDFR